MDHSSNHVNPKCSRSGFSIRKSQKTLKTILDEFAQSRMDSFVPLRTLAFLPPDVVVGQPYTLPPSKSCGNCRAAVVELCSAMPPIDATERSSQVVSKPLSTFRELRARTNCQLCQLIIKGVDLFCLPYTRHLTADDEQIMLHIRLNRRVLQGDTMINVCTSRFYVGTIRKVSSLVPLQNCQISGLEIDHDTVRTWLQICESTHSNCHSPIANSRQGTGLYPSLLIDVSRKCLVTAQVSSRYCALSYVYGGIQIFKTTARNFQMLQNADSLEGGWVDLPAVVRDAITLTERIGERFLWTDSLCIIHDEDEEFRDQISHMDIIYGQAVLTFAVVSGANANDAMPGVLPYSRSPLPPSGFTSKIAGFDLRNSGLDPSRETPLSTYFVHH